MLRILGASKTNEKRVAEFLRDNFWLTNWRWLISRKFCIPGIVLRYTVSVCIKYDGRKIVQQQVTILGQVTDKATWLIDLEAHKDEL